jgi:hypothetical protein
MFVGLACVVGSAYAQSDVFTASYSVALSNETAALSLQLPASANSDVRVLEATAQIIGGTCDVRIEVNGAAASVATGATAISLAPMDPEIAGAHLGTVGNRLQAWSGKAAAIPTGTYYLSPSTGWRIPSGGLIPFGGGRNLSGGGGTRNYIMRVLTGCTATEARLYISARVRR